MAHINFLQRRNLLFRLTVSNLVLSTHFQEKFCSLKSLKTWSIEPKYTIIKHLNILIAINLLCIIEILIIYTLDLFLKYKQC